MILIAQCLLGILRCHHQFPESSIVMADVLSVLVPDQFDEVVHDPPIKVLPPKERIKVSSQELKHTIHEREDACFGRAAADVQDKDVALVAELSVDAVGDGGGNGLVENPHGVQPSIRAGVGRRVP
uniref:Uncharacterized protein n=1 Tax=Arundo donax TaxID=35708 RepID=A0A0A8YN46_ARUDO